jgi:hypothetical protein
MEVAGGRLDAEARALLDTVVEVVGRRTRGEIRPAGAGTRLTVIRTRALISMASVAVLMRIFLSKQMPRRDKAPRRSRISHSCLSASRVLFAIWEQLKQGAPKGPCFSQSANCQEEILVQPH